MFVKKTWGFKSQTTCAKYKSSFPASAATWWSFPRVFFFCFAGHLLGKLWGFVEGPSADMPLLVPVKALEDGVES